MLAGGFGDAAVLHAGRTGGLTGATEQAELQMLFETVVQLDAPVRHCFDQVNSPTRRFGFKSSNTISRTLIQAQTAVDALIEFSEIQRRHAGLVTGLSGMKAMFQVMTFVSRGLVCYGAAILFP